MRDTILYVWMEVDDGVSSANQRYVFRGYKAGNQRETVRVV